MKSRIKKITETLFICLFIVAIIYGTLWILGYLR
jgi:hypothetical protein